MSIWQSFLAGLAQLVSIAPSPHPQGYPHRDEAEALRGDGWRVGTDFHRVLDTAPDEFKRGRDDRQAAE